MGSAPRLGLAAAAAFGGSLALAFVEASMGGQILLAVLSVAASGLAAGVGGRRAFESAAGAGAGSAAAQLLAVNQHLQLWNPGTSLDLLIVRLFVSGAAAFVGLGAGLLLSYISRPAPRPEEKESIEESVAVEELGSETKAGLEVVGIEAEPAGQIEKAGEAQPTGAGTEVEATPSVSEGAARTKAVTVQGEARICKFCFSVIPADAMFCPSCGNKLMET